jgi:hypothetical protein
MYCSQVLHNDTVKKEDLVMEIYTRCKDKSCSRFHSLTINEVEECVKILSNNINILNWIKDVNTEVDRLYWISWRTTGYILSNALRNGLNKAMTFHLLDLFEQLDDKYGFSSYHLSTLLEQEYNDNQTKYGFVDLLYILFNFNKKEMYANGISPNYSEFSIHFPEGFIFWNLNDLIKNFQSFISKNLMRIMDFDKFHASYICRNIKDFSYTLKITKQMLNVCYIFWNNEIIFDDVEQIPYLHRYFRNFEPEPFEIIMVIINNHYLQVYKEELMVVSWSPDRIFNWCLDEEEKQGILSKFLR